MSGRRLAAGVVLAVFLAVFLAGPLAEATTAAAPPWRQAGPAPKA